LISEIKTLPTELTAKLRKDILTEKITPGSRLTELSVCEKYRVSRTPVREAFRALESERLIELVPNRGAFVTGFSKPDVADLFRLRALLEVQATRWAVERAYQEELEGLEQTLEFMEFYTRRGDKQRIRDLNQTFHRNIRDASHNRQLVNDLSLYHMYLTESAHTKPIGVSHLNEIMEEHTAIFEAFVCRDSDMGGEAMRIHIENAAQRAL